MKRFRTRSVLLAAIPVVAVAAGAGYAAIPSPKGVYTACVLPTSGGVRVIDPSLAAHCTKSERRITWNAKGQPGPVGPAGPAGAAGLKGATGATGQAGSVGLSGYQIVTKPGTYTASTNNVTKVVADEVDCPSGKLALGGGGAGSLTVGNVGAGASELTSSVPSPAGTGWETGYAKLDGSYFATTEQLSYTTYVVCAKVAK